MRYEIESFMFKGDGPHYLPAGWKAISAEGGGYRKYVIAERLLTEEEEGELDG